MIDDDYTLEPDDIDQFGNRYAFYDEYMAEMERQAQAQPAINWEAFEI